MYTHLKESWVIFTWFRSPLEYRHTPFSMLTSLSDSNREFIHSISREFLNHEPSLWSFLIFPPSRLSLLPVSDSVLPKGKGQWLWHIINASWIALLFLFRHLDICSHRKQLKYITRAIRKPGLYHELSGAFLTWYLQGYFSVSWQADRPMWSQQTGETESSLWCLLPPLLHHALINIVIN